MARRTYTPDQMRRLLARRERHGWSFRQLSDKTGIPVSTLSYWRRRLEAGAAAGRRRFVPVRLTDHEEEPAILEEDRAAVTLTLPSGIRLDIPARFDDGDLARLLRVVCEAC